MAPETRQVLRIRAYATAQHNARPIRRQMHFHDDGRAGSQNLQHFKARRGRHQLKRNAGPWARNGTLSNPAAGPHLTVCSEVEHPAPNRPNQQCIKPSVLSCHFHAIDTEKS
jgi:hypothetical protein